MTASISGRKGKNPANWSKLSDEDWVALHVPRFKSVRPRFVEYQKVLKELFGQAVARLAPQAIVEARAKSIPSFAEKILRKRSWYKDPMVDMTDLCGGRVIVETADQVRAICHFIETHFDVDWPNSEDVSQRLRPTEFGYRSVHYIVSFKKGVFPNPDVRVKIPGTVLGLKAEIQVRTVLEHAWADLGHDMFYKGEGKTPNHIVRQYSAVAATLENADRDFSRLLADLEQYRSNYGAYLKKSEVESEIRKQHIILNQDPKNVPVAVKTARLAMTVGLWDTAIEVLRPHVESRERPVLHLLGKALCELHRRRRDSKGYKEGRRYLEEAASDFNATPEALCSLAEICRRDDPQQAAQLYRRAIKIDPSEPEALCAYLELQTGYQRNAEAIISMGPMIESAIQRCRKQIEARMNLQRAYLWLGKLQLLQGRAYGALSGFAKGIELCTSSAMLKEAIESLEQMEGISAQLPGYEWVRRLLLLGLAAGYQDRDALTTIRELASPSSAGGRPRYRKEESVVILAGGSDSSVLPRMEGYREMLVRAFAGFRGVIICGGTKEGISGLAGDVAQAYGDSVRAIGYVPANVPADATLDRDPSRYHELVQCGGSGFSPLEPLQDWIDLISSGIAPEDVKLLGLNGGEISAAEYMIAVALGARVALIERSGRSVEQMFNDPDWANSRLIRMPADAMTVRAFLLTDSLDCDRRKLEKAAKRVHKDYTISVTPKDDSLQPWESLNEDLKTSCFHQVAYAINILKTVDLGLRPLTDSRRPLIDMIKELGVERIRQLAEMEHGRWNTERLLLGWTRGEKDVTKKRNPSLVPWNELPPNIQDYDVNAILHLPHVMREAGLEVYRLPTKTRP